MSVCDRLEVEERANQRSGLSLTIGYIGKFLEDLIADEVVFGNTFERSIKDSLPWGTSVATKFM